MNKKILFGAALIGLMGFASCVDDTESASVTAVRQAKAEQLKAIAALDNANAEAALIAANAEKAAKEAQAAYNNAQAEYLKAQADYQNAKTETEREQAAITLEQMKAELDKKRAELQRTLAQVDQEIANAKYWEALYQKQYDDLLASIEDEKAGEIYTLLETYKQANRSLIDLKYQLAGKTSTLAGLEAGLANISKTINDEIADLEDKNVEKQLEINAQNAFIATYEKYAGTKVTEDMVNDAQLKLVELQVAYSEAKDKYNEAEKAMSDPQNAIVDYEHEVLSNWIYKYRNFDYSVWNDVTERPDFYLVTIEYVSNYYSVPSSARNRYCVVIRESNDAVGNNPATYLPLFEDYVYEYDNVRYETDWGYDEHWYGIYKYDYNLIDGGKALETLISYKEKEIADGSDADNLATLKAELSEQQKVKDAAQTAFDTAAKAYDTAKAAYDAAVAKRESADKAVQDNTDATKTEELQTALDDARKAESEVWIKLYGENGESGATGAKRNALDALDQATVALNDTQQMVNYYEGIAEQGAEELASLKEDVAALIEMGTALEENLKTYNTAATSCVEAWLAYKVANSAVDIQNNEYCALYNAYNGNGYLDGNDTANDKVSAALDKIDELTQEINTNKETIEGYKQDLADIEAGKYTKDEATKEMIDRIKNCIEVLNVEIEVAQQKYDIAKAELEAALEAE